jgi:hypothetical protein
MGEPGKGTKLTSHYLSVHCTQRGKPVKGTEETPRYLSVQPGEPGT